jgi:hypothetical protein
MTNLVADRLGVNMPVLKIASWVATAMLRRVALWDDNLVDLHSCRPRRRAGVRRRAFVELEPSDGVNFRWLSPGGRDSAAAYLLRLAALRQEL